MNGSTGKSRSADQFLYPELQYLSDIPPEVMLLKLVSALRRIAIMVWDRDGMILFANHLVALGYMVDSPFDVMGKNIKEFTPEKWAQERIDIANRAVDLDQPISLLEIQYSQRLHARYTPMSSDESDQSKSNILITVELVNPGGYKYLTSDAHEELTLHAQYNDLGRLDVLSNRELEVLALMGQGLRPKEIAKRLFRSLSTIENHRDNIGTKLGVKDRSELITMANLAVLQVEDAGRDRVHFPYDYGQSSTAK